jgi:serine/threonine protein kinase
MGVVFILFLTCSTEENLPWFIKDENEKRTLREIFNFFGYPDNGYIGQKYDDFNTIKTHDNELRNFLERSNTWESEKNLEDATKLINGMMNPAPHERFDAKTALKLIKNM